MGLSCTYDRGNRDIWADFSIDGMLAQIANACYRKPNKTTRRRRRHMALAERMTRLRVAKGESLQDVATAAGVSKAHIWELEKGRADNPSMALVTRLADHFGVSVAHMVGEDPAADGADGALARMFRQAQDLDPGDRELLDQLLQGFRKR